jgi:hypothetical protein
MDGCFFFKVSQMQAEWKEKLLGGMHNATRDGLGTVFTPVGMCRSEGGRSVRGGQTA